MSAAVLYPLIFLPAILLGIVFGYKKYSKWLGTFTTLGIYTLVCLVLALIDHNTETTISTVWLAFAFGIVPLLILENISHLIVEFLIKKFQK